jgi:hypothetical protein
VLLTHALEFRLERRALVPGEPIPHAPPVPIPRLRRAGWGFTKVSRRSGLRARLPHEAGFRPLPLRLR